MYDANSVTVQCRCKEYVMNLDEDCRVQIFLDYNNPGRENIEKQDVETIRIIIESDSNVLEIC